jgi:hypothetical protein
MYGTNLGFGLNGTYAEIDLTWLALEDDPDPNITGNVVRFNGGIPDPLIRKVLPSTQAKVGMGRRLWLNSLPDADNNSIIIFDWRDAANSIIATVSVDTTGRIVLNGGGGAEVRSAAPAIVANAWQHIEAELNAGPGSLECRVEGVTVASFTGRVFPSTAQVAVRITIGASTRQYLKDWVIWDGAGAFNNTWMGSIQVRELIPDWDSSFNWTTSSCATGWNLIDEAPPNDDTDYIIAINPPPAASRFDVSNLPVDVTSVRGLVAFVRSRKTDGGDGNLQVGVRSGASTSLGTDRPITTAYTYWSDVFETDPATGAAWTPAAVNGVKIQLNRTV